MKPRVSINLPEGLSSKIGKSPSKKSGGNRKRLATYVAQQQPTLKETLSSTSELKSEMSDTQRMDHNNLPYSWRRGGHQAAESQQSDTKLRKSAWSSHVRPIKGGVTSSRTNLLLQKSSSAPEFSRKESEEETSKTESTSPSTSPSQQQQQEEQQQEGQQQEEQQEGQQEGKQEEEYLPLESSTVAASSLQTMQPLPPPPIGADEPIPLWWDQPSFTRLDQSRMPLEAFDDTSMESKAGTPQDWLATCRTGRVNYYADGTWRWRRVTINSYNEIIKRFNVTFDGPAESKKRLEKNVRRLDLMFTDEDTSQFENRIQCASEYRERFKSALRFRTYLDEVYLKERASLSLIGEKFYCFQICFCLL